MKVKTLLTWWILLLGIKDVVYAQSDIPSLLNIDDTVPALRLSTWLKGEPVTRFERGNIYVLEFWATWCGPCKAAIPHLSALAHRYKGRAVFIGVNAYEDNTMPIEKIKFFVDTMGQRMDYYVAIEDSNFMVTDWMNASGERSIPKTFVIDGYGRLAWIGHPSGLADVLGKMVDGVWNNKEELAKRNRRRYLAELDDSLRYKLLKYLELPDKPYDRRNADTMLMTIKKFVESEPDLKYATLMAFFTFPALLQTNLHEAYKYGKTAIKTSTYEEPPYEIIIGAIKEYSNKLNLPTEIYALGAEAYQKQIEQLPYPEIIDTYKLYSAMAEWYWRSGNRKNAIESGRKAIHTMKEKGGFNVGTLKVMEDRLQKYLRK